MNATIRFRDVGVDFDGRTVLRDVDTSWSGPGLVSLIGPNGSGKTTLLRLAAGLVAPSCGRVTVEVADREVEAARRPGGTIAMVDQVASEHTWMPARAREVLSAGMRRRRVGRGPHAAVPIDEAVARLGVSELLDEQFVELSGGQRQRVRLAAAVASPAPVLLLDEPMTGLDGDAQDLVRACLAEEIHRGRLVVQATHHLDDARLGDRVVVVAGAVVDDGSPDEVLRRFSGAG